MDCFDSYIAEDAMDLELFSTEYWQDYIKNGKFLARIYMVLKDSSLRRKMAEGALTKVEPGHRPNPDCFFIFCPVCKFDMKNKTVTIKKDAFLDIYGDLRLERYRWQTIRFRIANLPENNG